MCQNILLGPLNSRLRCRGLWWTPPHKSVSAGPSDEIPKICWSKYFIAQVGTQVGLFSCFVMLRYFQLKLQRNHIRACKGIIVDPQTYYFTFYEPKIGIGMTCEPSIQCFQGIWQLEKMWRHVFLSAVLKTLVGGLIGHPNSYFWYMESEIICLWVNNGTLASTNVISLKFQLKISKRDETWKYPHSCSNLCYELFTSTYFWNFVAGTCGDGFMRGGSPKSTAPQAGILTGKSCPIKYFDTYN